MGLVRNIGLGIGGSLLLGLYLLNTLGGIVAGIWLAVTGQWGAIGFGLVAGFIMPTAWMLIAFLPAMLFLVPAAALDNRGHTTLALVLGFFGAAIQYCANAAWILGMFVLLMDRAEPGTAIPMLIWIYTTVMIPLQYMARKESADAVGTHMALAFAIAAWLMLTILYFFDVAPITTIYWLAGLIVVATGLNVAVLGVEMTGQRRADRMAVEMKKNYDEDTDVYDEYDELDEETT